MENGGGETVALPSDRAAVDRVVGACDVKARSEAMKAASSASSSG